MIVVIEGINGSGKTTAVEYISNAYNFVSYRAFRKTNYQHNHEIVNKAFEELVISDFLLTVKSEKNIIFDRSLISSYVYKMYCGDTTINFNKHNYVEWLKNMETSINSPFHIIYIETDLEIAMKRMIKSSGIYNIPGDIIKNKIDEIQKNYDKVLNFTRKICCQTTKVIRIVNSGLSKREFYCELNYHMNPLLK